MRRPSRHLVLPLLLAAGSALPAGAAAAPLTLQSVYLDKTGMLDPLSWTIPDAGGSATFGPTYGTAWYAFPLPTTIPDGGVNITISAQARSKSRANMAASVGIDGDAVRQGPVEADAIAPPGGSDQDAETVRLFRAPTGVAIVRVALLDGPRYTYTYTGPGSEPSTDCGGAAATRAAAASVRVLCLDPGVAYHRRGRPASEWKIMDDFTVLRQGDQVSAGADGQVTLAFPGRTTVVLKHNSEIQLSSLSRTRILLGMGEVDVTAGKSGVRLTTTSFSASAAGARFSSFFDPGSKSGLVWTSSGSAKADPLGSKLPTRSVPHGKEVEITPKAISGLARTGRAGARGGLDLWRALELVNKVVARSAGVCEARTLHMAGTAVKPGPGGWSVTVKLAGGLKGASTWAVKGRQAKPVNAIAQKLASGCS